MDGEPALAILERREAGAGHKGLIARGARCELDMRDFVDSGHRGQEAPWTRRERERRIAI